ncbi:hypothetical protein SNE26_07335 [Mucilaginibacter sp. cycad4]|uniref:hypothetical protein n=1 Tax=Mucilaginibacter sp. cycad4 TaxID=3342096 RepID=UPI002AAB7D85|nr:hypothetical protein [Mucilaginibacter gossypii]WPV01585.1 hypothetical protein SNE26_07335 [Mucilaginibacter gossypii]
MKSVIIVIFITTILLPFGRISAQTRAVTDSAKILKLKSDLNIDLALAEKVSDAMQFNETQIRMLMKEKNLRPEERHRQFLMLIRQREEKVKALLTPDQLATLSRSIFNHIGKGHFGRRDSLSRLKEREACMLSGTKVTSVEYSTPEQN